METYEEIRYFDYPHFTLGRVDQWGEHGYLLFEGNVHFYEEDRKEQCGSVHAPTSIDDFLAYAEQQQILVPPEFLEALKKVLNDGAVARNE